MTSNHHTPIPSSPQQPANASTINDPLGELDAAITDHETRIIDLEEDMPVPSGSPTEYLDGEGNWTVPAGTGAGVDGHEIQDEGVPLPQRAAINFVGAGVIVTDEMGGTQVEIPGGGVTAHADLSGLSDDDHPQYHNNTRGDARYVLRSNRKSRNEIINGGFAVWQRSTPTALTTFANRTYWADRWYTEHDAAGGSGAQFRRWKLGDASIPVAPTYSDTFAEIKNAGSAAAGLLWSQSIESYEAVALRGKTMMLMASAMVSAGTPTIKYKVFGWSGTRDHTDCKKLVASWSGGHAPTFNTTNLTELADGSLVLSTSWQSLSLVVSAPASGVRNIIICFWVENLPVGESIYFSEADFTTDNVVRMWEAMPLEEEIRKCGRFYTKSYDIDTPPGTNTVNSLCSGVGLNVGQVWGACEYGIRMRALPTVTIYSRIGTVNKISSLPTTDIGAAAAAGATSDVRFGAVVDSGNPYTANVLYGWHYTADAEI